MLQELSPKQLTFLKESHARINIAEGAVRSGKSFVILIRFMEELRNGPDGEYIVTGKSLETCERNVVTPLQNLTGHTIAYNQGRRYFTLFDKKVYVVGANDERASSKIKGATSTQIIQDDPHAQDGGQTIEGNSVELITEKQADTLVRENPYYTAGIAAGIGAIIGILVSRSLSSKN